MSTNHSPFDLTGKVALITGASKGLGKAMALALSGAVSSIALVSRDEGKLAEVHSEISAHGTSEIFVADVRQESQVEKPEREIAAKMGKIHVLINNAGINIRKNLVDFTFEEWQSVMDTNLTSVFLMCRAFVPHMQRAGYGWILNLTSIMSHVSLPQRTAYSASKQASWD